MIDRRDIDEAYIAVEFPNGSILGSFSQNAGGCPFQVYGTYSHPQSAIYLAMSAGYGLEIQHVPTEDQLLPLTAIPDTDDEKPDEYFVKVLQRIHREDQNELGFDYRRLTPFIDRNDFILKSSKVTGILGLGVSYLFTPKDGWLSFSLPGKGRGGTYYDLMPLQIFCEKIGDIREEFISKNINTIPQHIKNWFINAQNHADARNPEELTDTAKNLGDKGQREYLQKSFSDMGGL